MTRNGSKTTLPWLSAGIRLHALRWSGGDRKALISERSGQGYDPAAISGVVEVRRFPGPTKPLEQVLRLVCGTVKDKLDHTADEMDNLLAGTEGWFVPPSLGGKPTRAAWEAEGLAEDKASEQFRVRVFGCAPGCYGTGVPHIIDSKERGDFQDLAKGFETWSSCGYTSSEYGESRPSLKHCEKPWPDSANGNDN